MSDNSYHISPTMYKMLPWIAAVAFFMQSLDNSILNTALPTIAADLHESPLNMQSAVISYVLAVALFIPVSGFLADRFGTRNVFVVAVALFSVGSLLCAMSTSLIYLALSRFIQGVGGAMMVPVSRLTLIKSFKRNEFLAALNASMIPGLIGPILGPVLGGYLVQIATWHWIFLINLPIGVLGVIVAWKFMPNIQEKRTAFDAVGVLFIATAIILATVNLELLHNNIHALLSLAIFLACLLFFYLYYRHARKAPSPIFSLLLFKIHTFRIGIIGNLVSRLGISAAPFLLPLMLQVGFGFSAIKAGLMLVPMAIGSITMKTFVQPILRHLGYRNVLISNTMIVGCIIMSMSLLDQNTSYILFFVLLFCLGCANSLQFTSMNSITLADLHGRLTSSGNSLMAVNQQLAISFGVAFAAILVRVFSDYFALDDNGINNASRIYAFKASFILLGLISFCSSFIFHYLHKNDGKNLVTKVKTDSH